MNFTSSATKASVISAACTVGILGMAASADAATFLQGSITINATPGNGAEVTTDKIIFGEGSVTQATEDFFSLKGTSSTIKTIDGLSNGFNSIGPKAGFIDFGLFTLGSKTETLFFNLLSATVQTQPISSPGFSPFVSHLATDLVGNFVFDGTTVAKGILSAQQTGTSGWTIGLQAQPIPTPALLPGLVGLGVAALRRKQDDETAEENA